jgi:hypothetical protein
MLIQQKNTTSFKLKTNLLKLSELNFAKWHFKKYKSDLKLGQGYLCDQVYIFCNA